MEINQNIVRESVKTAIAREKLKRKYQVNETSSHVEGKISEIHQRICRTSSYRVPITKKSMSLFDDNNNPAIESDKVKEVFEKIRMEYLNLSDLNSDS